MALLALGSAAALVKLQQRLMRRWSKKWARFANKTERKRSLKRAEDELHKVLQDHGATATI
eukprot:7980003-Lingulodinium_polyedra.AAC.1